MLATARDVVDGRADFEQAYDIAIWLLPELALSDPPHELADLASAIVAFGAEEQAGEYSREQTLERLAAYMNELAPSLEARAG